MKLINDCLLRREGQIAAVRTLKLYIQEKYEDEDTDQMDTIITHSNSNQVESAISEDSDVTDFIEDMTDCNEDFSYDEHLKQYDTTRGKVSHSKKGSCQRLRQRQVTLKKKVVSPKEENESESSLPAFCTFDVATMQNLKSIISINSYHSGQYCKILGKGANSVVLHAWISEKTLVHDCILDKDYMMWGSNEYAVKVYKLSENQINNERICQRVQKEKQHLDLLCKAKSYVPDVVRCSQNVIIMEMLGADLETAPSITSSPLNQSQEIYQTIVKEIEMWYKTLHLVHGRLNSKKILYHYNNIYYIGWSHSVRTDHPLALKKLMRDCLFITKFFERRLISVKSTETLFKYITGLNKIDSSVLSVIQSKDLWKSQHLTNPNRANFNRTHTTGRHCCFKV